MTLTSGNTRFLARSMALCFAILIAMATRKATAATTPPTVLPPHAMQRQVSMRVTPLLSARPDLLHPEPWLAGVTQEPEVGPVTLYGPPSNVPVRGLALFASGDGGWNLGVIDMARRAAASGLWVAGFSTPTYFRSLAKKPASVCASAAGTLRTLATSIEGQLGLDMRLPVVLIGYSSGATLVYAALIQAKPGIFQGGLSLGFCPELEVRHPFCPGVGNLSVARSKIPPHWPALVHNTRVQAPWHILQGEIDEVCAPSYAPQFVSGVPGAKAWVLPHVGHGFGYPRNWGLQYMQALDSLLPPASIAPTPTGPDASHPPAQLPRRNADQ